MQPESTRPAAADIAERGVPTSPIVPDFDPREHCRASQFSRFLGHVLNDFMLEGAAETLDDGIVPAIFPAALTRNDSMALVNALHRGSGILRAVVKEHRERLLELMA